ncbi:hypothetical protein lbkm_0653 [Lachnospiraceae bacterium KM106-2]|nr:hypothetical protein lbkm_0653 [Lachnospiraceae bacterium KM106-2]
MNEKYYSDGVTKYSDPFHKNLCMNCGHEYWTAMISDGCTRCGSKNIFHTFDDEELEKAKLQYLTYKKGSKRTEVE